MPYRLRLSFQSRNRGSFDFKCGTRMLRLVSICCFNLVIEVLLISRATGRCTPGIVLLFQSRNRGSFDFKPKRNILNSSIRISFNLVIEVLLISSSQSCWDRQPRNAWFQSRNRGSFDFKAHSYIGPENLCICFNLVIEVLLISSANALFVSSMSDWVSIS